MAYFSVLLSGKLTYFGPKSNDMKKNYTTTLIVCSLTAFSILTGCGKKDKPDPPPAPKTKTELITTSTWKFSSATIGGFNVAGSLQTCQKDNVMTFAAAGTGTVDEGATKCSGGDAQTNPFTWNFQTNETTLFVSATLFTGGSSTFTVVDLTETQLVLSQMTTLMGPPQNVVVTFIH